VPTHKNTLTAADADLVAAGFRAKLALFGDGRPGDGLRGPSEVWASATRHIVSLFPRKPALFVAVSHQIHIIFGLRNLVRSVAK